MHPSQTRKRESLKRNRRKKSERLTRNRKKQNVRLTRNGRLKSMRARRRRTAKLGDETWRNVLHTCSRMVDMRRTVVDTDMTVTQAVDTAGDTAVGTAEATADSTAHLRGTHMHIINVGVAQDLEVGWGCLFSED